MKITEIWKANLKPTLSFELFPPRSQKAAETFDKVIDDLVNLKPDLVSVTFGAVDLHGKDPVSSCQSSKLRRVWKS